MFKHSSKKKKNLFFPTNFVRFLKINFVSITIWITILDKDSNFPFLLLFPLINPHTCILLFIYICLFGSTIVSHLFTCLSIYIHFFIYIYMLCGQDSLLSIVGTLKFSELFSKRVPMPSVIEKP